MEIRPSPFSVQNLNWLLRQSEILCVRDLAPASGARLLHLIRRGAPQLLPAAPVQLDLFGLAAAPASAAPATKERAR